MKCKDFEKKIFEFIEDKINEFEKEKFKEHMEKCKECKSLYDDFIFILNNSKKIEVTKLNDDYWKSKIKSIFEREEKRSNFLKPVYVAVSLFILLSVTLFLMKININIPISKKNIPISKLDLINHELPFSDEEIINNVDYMKDEEIEKVLEIIFKGF